MENDTIHFNEYGEKMPGVIRHKEHPIKCNIAVIPAITVDTVDNIKGLADCFVHVTNINTTYYVDDKHRAVVTFAGPVFEDDYDYVTNPLNLRKQSVYDFANNRCVVYNKIGRYKVITLGD